MKRKSILYMTQGALIAALYVVLTLLSSAVGLASGVIQCRLSEALCILPFFTAAAVPGLTVGCFLANLIAGCAPWDVVFGTTATLLGAIGCRMLKKTSGWLSPLPNILANTLIIPFVLRWVYGAEDALWFLFLTVGTGEMIAGGVLGVGLFVILRKHRQTLFPDPDRKADNVPDTETEDRPEANDEPQND